MMMKIAYIKTVVACLFMLSLTIMLSSCSDEDYLCAIPGNCVALASVDVQRLVVDAEKGKSADDIAKLLKIDDIEDCGIDFSAKIYAFETNDGNIGIVGKVSDDDKLDVMFDKLSIDGLCRKTSEYRDYRTTVIKDTWVAVYSSAALVIVGPVLPSQQSVARQQISKYLDSGQSARGTRLFDKLESMSVSVAVVAQASALPEKLAALFTIGAPKGSDASQIMIAAGLEEENGCIVVRGETFAFNDEINTQLKKSMEVFRPITGKYLSNMPSDAALGAFMNVNGGQFIRLLHANTTFQALLAGINMAVDMDNIIKSIDGDVAIVLPDMNDAKSDLRICAELAGKKFLDDVDYWKKSCPEGSKIVDNGRDSYCYISADMSFNFGVSPDMQFYSCGSDVTPDSVLSETAKPLQGIVRDKIRGRRFAVVANLGSLIGNDISSNTVLASLLGPTSTVVYIMK